MLNHTSMLIIIQLPIRHQNLIILIMKFNKVRNTHYRKIKKKNHIQYLVHMYPFSF